MKFVDSRTGVKGDFKVFARKAGGARHVDKDPDSTEAGWGNGALEGNLSAAGRSLLSTVTRSHLERRRALPEIFDLQRGRNSSKTVPTQLRSAPADCL